MNEVVVQVVNDSDFRLPFYATEGAAGMDVTASSSHTILPGDTIVIGTGLKVSVPVGYELQVRPRSGLSLKTPIRVANAPGTIDSDYRGEVGVILTNTHDSIPVLINAGDRIAQLVLCPVFKCVWQQVDYISDTTHRGTGGFGSTGV